MANKPQDDTAARPAPDAETVALPPSEAASDDIGLGDRIGRYQLHQVIASGGMGTVYLAEQDQPRRQVAVKLMKQGFSSGSLLRRFEFEAQVLARLRHPNIAQVYEAGTHDDGSGGVPYFAMEYIPNAQPLTDYARRANLSTADRLRLFAKVCEAVHHGHQRGVIHRDLKPSNILVDPDGEPKIIDFGVARATDADMAYTTVQTAIGQLIGTLQYMSPEQCDANPGDLDTRSDVYALGVVLYELLTDQLPYDLAAMAIHEAVGLIRHATPTPPSTINRVLRGDVETITLKALEKDRSRRYQSASDLGRDIERYLHDEPIEARPPSALYQMRKFARRHRPAFIAISAIIVTLIASTTVSVLFGLSEAEQRRLAGAREDEANIARALAEFEAYAGRMAATSAGVAIGDFAEARTQHAAAPASQRRWEWYYYDRVLNAAAKHLDDVNDSTRLREVRFFPEPWDSLVAFADVEDHIGVFDSRTGDVIARWSAHTDSINEIAVFANENRGGFASIASVSQDGFLRLWSADDGTMKWEVSYRAEDDTTPILTGIQTLRFRPDGNVLAYADKVGLRIYDVASGNQVRLLKRSSKRGHVTRDGISGVAFSRDGTVLYALVGTGEVGYSRLCRWNADSWEELDPVRLPVSGLQLAAAPDSDLLAFGHLGGGGLYLYDPNTSTFEQLKDAADTRVTGDIVFARGGRVIVPSPDLAIRIWNAQTRELEETLLGRTQIYCSLTVDAAGERLLSTHEGEALLEWSARLGISRVNLGAPFARMQNIAFHPSGDLVSLAASRRHFAVTHHTLEEAPAVIKPRIYRDKGGIEDIAYHPGTGQLMCATIMGRIAVYDVDTGTLSNQWDASPDGSAMKRLAYNSDGSLLATCHSHGPVHLWGAENQETPRTIAGPLAQPGSLQNMIAGLSWHPAGDRIAIALHQGSVRVVDADTLQTTLTLQCPNGTIDDVAFSTHGEVIAVATRSSPEHPVYIFDSNTGALMHTLPQGGSAASLAFHPTEPRLAVALTAGTIRIWDTEAWSRVVNLPGKELSLQEIAFSPDGESLCVVGSNTRPFLLTSISIREQLAAGAGSER